MALSKDHAIPRYLALGDSYTIGEGVDVAQRWPVQLVRQLHRRGTTLAGPQIVATTGWTTDQLAAAMKHARLDPPYRLVSLLIGVNDQYRGRAAGPYRQHFRGLLQWAVALAGGHPDRVLAVSIPDWGVTPFAHSQGRDGVRVAAELDDYNAIARDECRRAQARWIDVTAISRRHPLEVTADGLHPSAEQYRMWTAAILPQATAALRRDA